MTARFQRLMAEVMARAERFGHREHLHLTWLAVRHYGVTEAISVVSAGIQHTARYANAPQKYHATISRAWVELVGHHVHDEPDIADFSTFADRNPALLDKRLISRFYHPTTLASHAARTGWLNPDRQTFPWHRPASGGTEPSR